MARGTDVQDIFLRSQEYIGVEDYTESSLKKMLTQGKYAATRKQKSLVKSLLDYGVQDVYEGVSKETDIDRIDNYEDGIVGVPLTSRWRREVKNRIKDREDELVIEVEKRSRRLGQKSVVKELSLVENSRAKSVLRERLRSFEDEKQEAYRDLLIDLRSAGSVGEVSSVLREADTKKDILGNTLYNVIVKGGEGRIEDIEMEDERLKREEEAEE